MTLVGVPLPSICRSTPGVHRRPGSSTHPEPIPHGTPIRISRSRKRRVPRNGCQSVQHAREYQEGIPLPIGDAQAVQSEVGAAECRQNLGAGSTSPVRFARFAHRARGVCPSL